MMPKKPRTTKRKVTQKRRRGFPTLGEMMKDVPRKGLLDPSLRRDIGDVRGLAPTK